MLFIGRTVRVGERRVVGTCWREGSGMEGTNERGGLFSGWKRKAQNPISTS